MMYYKLVGIKWDDIDIKNRGKYLSGLDVIKMNAMAKIEATMPNDPHGLNKKLINATEEIAQTELFELMSKK